MSSRTQIKNIENVEKDIHRDIEIRQIVPPLIRKSIGQIVELEQRIGHDFFSVWLPEKARKYIKLVFPLVLMILILTLPVPVDPQIKKALALFICIALLWALETFSMIVTALLIPVLAVGLGLSSKNPFESFAHPIIYLLLSGLILAQAFRKTGLNKDIALKVLSLSKGNIRRLLFYTMFISATLGMWMSNTANIALLIPVIFSIQGELSKRLDSKNYLGMLLLSTGFSVSIGGMTTILGGNPNAITAAFLGDKITFLSWMKIGLPTSVLLFVTAYYVFIRIYKVGKEKVNIQEISKKAKKRLTHNQLKLLAIFIPTIVFWIGGNSLNFFNLPDELFSTEIIGLLFAIMLFGLKVLSWEDVRRIPWEILLLVGGGLTLGNILIKTKTADIIASAAVPFLGGLPNILIIAIVIAVSIFLANFVNNSSTSIILVPVILQLSPKIDMDPVLLAITVAFATGISALTPIAIPSFSLIYGTGKIKRSEMVKTGVAIATSCGIVLCLVITLISYL